MSKNIDLRTSFKALTENLTAGNKSAADVAGSLNLWLKEGGEALKIKIEDEVERSVSKMGFIKRGEFEALKQQVEALTSGKASVQKKQPKNKTAEKKSSKKSTGEKKGKGGKKKQEKKASNSISSKTAKKKR